MARVRVGIVGAGAAGLSLGVMLKRKGHHVTVLEAQTVAGGLCQSKDGVDLFGPHILGGIPEAVQWVKDTTGIEFHQGVTENAGYYFGQWVAHPFADDLIANAYINKMWKGHDPRGRASHAAQVGRQPGGVKTFEYPAGGYQRITDAWAAELGNDIRYGMAVDCDSDLSPFFDRIVWCAPLGLRRPFLGLTTVTRSFADFSFDTKLTAVYLPSPESLFHRLNCPGNIQGVRSQVVQAEMTTEQGVMVGWGTVQAELTKTLRFLFGIEENEGHDHVAYHGFAYPIPTPGDQWTMYDDKILHGRSGAHQYLNIDGVVAASLKLAEAL